MGEGIVYFSYLMINYIKQSPSLGAIKPGFSCSLNHKIKIRFGNIHNHTHL